MELVQWRNKGLYWSRWNGRCWSWSALLSQHQLQVESAGLSAAWWTVTWLLLIDLALVLFPLSILFKIILFFDLKTWLCFFSAIACFVISDCFRFQITNVFASKFKPVNWHQVWVFSFLISDHQNGGKTNRVSIQPENFDEVTSSFIPVFIPFFTLKSDYIVERHVI